MKKTIIKFDDIETQKENFQQYKGPISIKKNKHEKSSSI